MLRRRQRFVASIVAAVAMVVVVLFAYGEILGAQQERTVIAFCSHPGASRYLDGSFLNDDPSKGDVVAVHYSPAPGVDDYFRESVAESGVHPTLEWLTYSNWSALIEVPRDQHGDIIVDSNGTIDCTLYAEFQIGKRTGANEYTYRVANAQVGPCVPSTDGVTHVSVRVWLNKNKNPEHEAKPCGEEVPGELEIISRPVTPSQPLVTTPTGGGGRRFFRQWWRRWRIRRLWWRHYHWRYERPGRRLRRAGRRRRRRPRGRPVGWAGRRPAGWPGTGRRRRRTGTRTAGLGGVNALTRFRRWQGPLRPGGRVTVGRRARSREQQRHSHSRPVGAGGSSSRGDGYPDRAGRRRQRPDR